MHFCLVESSCPKSRSKCYSYSIIAHPFNAPRNNNRMIPLPTAHIIPRPAVFLRPVRIRLRHKDARDRVLYDYKRPRIGNAAPGFLVVGLFLVVRAVVEETGWVLQGVDDAAGSSCFGSSARAWRSGCGSGSGLVVCGRVGSGYVWFVRVLVLLCSWTVAW
jgi:hypothetical protein